MKKNSSRNRGNGMVSANDIAKAYNITYQAVNHYTNFGLLPVSSRKGNTRFYDKGIVAKRMKQVKELMGEGYSLGLIRRRLIGI